MRSESTPALAIPDRRSAIRSHRERGGRIAAVFPVHQPRALFRAFDLLPVEVWGPPSSDPAHADADLQAYTCSIVRRGLGFVRSGGLDIADVLVVPHACDSLQGLGSVLLDLAHPGRPVLPFYLPRRDDDAGVVFLARELEALFERLVEITGSRPADGRLEEAIHREEAADALLARLHLERSALGLDDRALYRLIRSREYLPAEDFSELAAGVLERPRGDQRRGIPVVLSGIVPEPVAIFDVIAAAGGVVVADDLACCGRRLYPRGSGDDPFVRLARSLLGGPPDSTRGAAVQSRLDHLRALTERTGARAVVFLVVKFCEPELFYLPLLRSGLDALGLRSVTLEVDIGDQLPSQAETRVQALLETL